MQVIQFSMYYFTLQLGVMIGVYHTSYPMDIHWRWRFWQQRHSAQRPRLR